MPPRQRAAAGNTGARTVNGNQTTNGNVYATAFITSGDERLKLDILGYERGLEHVMRLRPARWRRENGLRQYGLVAQDVEEIIPEAVVEMNGVKGLDVMTLIAVLLNASRRLGEKIEALENEAHRRD